MTSNGWHEYTDAQLEALKDARDARLEARVARLEAAQAARVDIESAYLAAQFFDFENGTSYGLAAMERELGRLATAPVGQRNNTLNRVSFSLAQLVAGGELRAEHVIHCLEAVALQIGLEMWEVGPTIQSGWTAGEVVPRQAPARLPGVSA